MWVARDEDGLIFLYSSKPIRGNGQWMLNIEECSDLIPIDDNSFPNLRWEDEPLEIKLVPKYSNNEGINEEELEELAKDYSCKEYGYTGTGHFVGINDFKAGYRKAKELL